MLYRQIVDEKLAQYAYLIGCPRTGEALLVDPERDIDRYLELAASEGLRIAAVAETHIHADFLSGSRELAERLPDLRLYLSDEGDADWKYEWVDAGDPRVVLLKHGDRFRVGNIDVEAVHTPGHTPEHMSFLVTDRGGGAEDPMGVLSGDFLFVGDLGRPDLLESAAGHEGVQEPSARRLYASTRDFLRREDHLQIWPAHGAGSACGKALGDVPQSTLGYERRYNAAIGAAGRSETEFVDFILEGQPDPPLYFARMKRDNKIGPRILGRLPTPRELDPAELAAVREDPQSVIVDTRACAEDYLSGHVKGSIYAPLDRSFPTVVGSFLRPEDKIHLIVEADHVNEAVRDLIRIGLDRVEGFLPADRVGEAGADTSTASIDFATLERRRGEDIRVLDVRKTSEYADGHIPDSLHIPHTRLASRLDELPRDRELLVHCQSGKRAKAAVSLLERAGFHATLVDDAFPAWCDANASRVEVTA